MSSEPLVPPKPTDGTRGSHAGDRRAKHILLTVGVILLLSLATAAGVIFSGLFNVAATQVDARALEWVLVNVREASIARKSRNIRAPDLTGAARRDDGFRIYRKECVMCHTPVGRKPMPMAVGFNPQAPRFGPDADDMTPAELFWVTKQGIRFTGMPAWGPSRSDEEIWDVVAFLMTLPDMSAADYDALDQRIPPAPARH